MAELLIELFSEEIPARFQARAAVDLQKLLNQALLDAGYLPEGVTSFGGPRRLTFVATGLPVKQPDVREEKKGPRVGAPEKAVEGFLKSAGLGSLEDCETREDKKGSYYVAVVERLGRPTTDVIADALPDIVTRFPWQKAMRWGDESAEDTALKWVRPLHRILCVFDHEIVPLKVGSLEASDVTEGHRFHAPDPVSVRSFEKYAETLRASKVILSAEEREEIIARDARTLCEAQGLELIDDKSLLNEVAGLAEWPIVLMGTFDEKFLTVPDEALTASMRGHQKYFSVRNPGTGRLANKFICVANIEASDGGAAMRQGYERVLTARLSDAWFLYRQDLKIALEERLPDLDRITFFEGLGTVGDKVRRLEKLARDIAPSVGADPDAAAMAARLAKTDLVTGMVYEFPELQGLMGRYYALEQGINPDVANAIRDHYKPLGQGGEVPTARVSVAAALADKIDTLTAFWSIDKKPTGSSDPFALRRAALGVIALILDNQLRLPLTVKLGEALTGVATTDVQPISEDLLGFFHDRLVVYLRDLGFAHDQVAAVLVDADGQLQDDLFLVVEKLKAFGAFLKGEDGANLLAGFKRAANILKAEEKKGDIEEGDVDPALATETAEAALLDALGKAEGAASEALAAERFEDAMKALSTLRAPIDTFFEEVTVNAEDPALRANRLALLQRFRRAVLAVADFEKLEG
ncbi:MAG: glycine--tRNA ligase subunit beta [Pseudomonadota bacterium]